VIDGFVEQQHVGLGEQQLARRRAPLLAAGQVADHGVPGRQRERIRGDIERWSESLPEVARIASYLAGSAASASKSASGLGVGRSDLLELLLRLHGLAQPGLDFLAHGERGVERRLLRQIADLEVGHRHRLAFDVGNISLSFCLGAKIDVLGLNGSGKSTLLKIMCRIDCQDRGRRHQQRLSAVGQKNSV